MSAAVPDYPCYERHRVRVHRVVRLVARHFDLRIAAILGPCRARELCRARWVAMALLWEEEDMPLRSIAMRLGRRDHSTVVHGLARVAADPSLQRAVAQVGVLLRKEGRT
jgi:chromosomal replication initiator protein